MLVKSSRINLNHMIWNSNLILLDLAGALIVVSEDAGI